MGLFNSENKFRMTVIKYQKFFSTLLNPLKGDSLSNIVKRNIIASFFLKGFNIILVFLLVPMLLYYLDTTKYGLWLTIASVIQWFGFFDIGLGNGLRNKFAEAKALGDTEKAKIYISTSYLALFIISLAILIVLIPVFYFLDWAKLLNAPIYLSLELKIVVIITLIFFMIRLVLQLIGSILLGDQKSALNDALNPLSNLLTIILVSFFALFYKNSFILTTFSLAAAPVIIYLIVSYYLFNKNYKDLRPRINFVNFSYVKPLFNLGVLFFIIQSAGVVLYTTTNFLITQLLNPSEVTKYNIAYRYFSSVLMIFSIVVNPLWSAFTSAYAVKDFLWIEKINKKLRSFGLLFISLIIVMIFFADTFYKFWIGDKIQIDFLLSTLMGIFFAITIFTMPFCYFLNGVGRIKEQAILSVIVAVIHIPLSILLVKNYNFGLAGIMLSLILISLPGLFIYPYLYKKELIKIK